MADWRALRRNSIGAKIFAALAALSLVAGALGAYGYCVLSAAGTIVVETYDGALMEINYARSASLTFTRMNNVLLRRGLAPEGERGAFDEKLDQLTASFFGDFDVVAQRTHVAKELATIAQIRELVSHWNALRSAGPLDDQAIEALSARIFDRFDMLIELTTDHGFVERQRAMRSILDFRVVTIGATVTALFFSAAIAFVLTRRIVRPLAAAAAVADRISAGEFQTAIPSGGRDETGILLHSMTVMQDNIRVMMEREAAKRQSAQNRLVDAVESSPEGVVLVDAEGRIVLANSQVASFFPNIDPQALPGADFDSRFALVRPFIRPRTMAQKMAAGEGPPTHGESQLMDGRWIRFSRSRTRDGGFFLLLSDFTEVKEREERLLEAKQQAEVANKAKSSFLANMSHELRTPLNAIIGFSEMITGQMFGPVGNPVYVEYSGHVLQSGRHLLDLIVSVLELAKSESGKLHLRPELVDLRETIDECTTMVRPQCEGAKLRFVVTAPERPLPVLGEPVKLRQMLVNLLSNAVKFTEPGGTVFLSAGVGPAGIAELRVGDTGIGMSPADVVVALTPFGQVDGKLARRYEGAGLGLPLTKAMVELHKGELKIESEPGKGTVVTISLPGTGMVAMPAPRRAAVG